MNENKIEIPSGGMIEKPVGLELVSDKKEIFAPAKDFTEILEETRMKDTIEIKIDYMQMLKWVKTEYAQALNDLLNEMLEKRRTALKKSWGKISVEEFRERRKTIDREASLMIK